MKIAVIAYSGGLDTSYCLLNLTKEYKYNIHTVIINTGGFLEKELKEIEERAYALGSLKHVCIDITENFYNNCLKYLLFGNVLKGNTYPLSVSAERIFQAIAIAKYAKKEKANYIVHGSTGAGNDQIRFDIAFSVICPEIEVITPIRDNQITRKEEIKYLKVHGFEYIWEKSKYSINKGIWGTSISGGETLTSNEDIPSEAFPSQFSAIKNSLDIEIKFSKGEPISINKKKFKHPVKVIQELNKIGGSYAIGRDYHIGDTILGIKGRIAFEAAASIILIKAHHLLEKHTLSRWQLIQKEQIANWYGTLLHEAQFMDPIMRNFEAFLISSQERVSGSVFITLKPYHFTLNGINSSFDMMQSNIAMYGEENNTWSSVDVKGFIKIFSNQLKIWNSIKK